jgi:hypothetical protein
MPGDRPQAGRILVARLTGGARHRAKWRALTGDEEDAAVAEFQALAGGRADLLAEVAGIFEGTSEGELDEPLARCAAGLCRKAGADPVTLEYSIARLICAFLRGREAMMAGWPGAAQDRIPAGPPGTQPLRPAYCA